jgi:hypothetical protein
MAVGLDREVVQAARTGERAEEGDRRALLRKAEAAPALGLRRRAVRGRHGTARDAVLRPVAARDPVGEEDAAGEGRREPVREPEVRIGLGQRGRDLPSPGGVDHRPGDVAAAAEDDVRAAAPEDLSARARRAARPQERAQQGDGGPARKAGDLERVELVARLGDEPSLDAIRRSGERHADAALPQRLRDGERRQDVTRRSARGDQAPQPVVALAHRPRC